MLLTTETQGFENGAIVNVAINRQEVTTFHASLDNSIGWVTEVDGEEVEFRLETTDVIEDDRVSCFSIYVNGKHIRSTLGYVGAEDNIDTTESEEVHFEMYHAGEGYMSSAWFECFDDEDRQRMKDGEVIEVLSAQLVH